MIRRILPVLLAVLFLALPAGAQEWGESATPVSPVNLRQSRDLGSPSRDVLMPGEIVRVDFLRDGWYAVFRLTEKTRDESRALGYARAGFFKPAPAGAAVSTTSPAASPAPHPKQAAVKPPVPAEDVAASTKETTPASAAPSREETPKPSAPTASSTSPEAAPPIQAAARHSNAWGELRSADRQLAVRAKRDPVAEHVRTLKAGEVVKVDFLHDGWFAVFPPDALVRDESRAIGYSKARFLLPAGKNVTLARVEPRQPLPVSSKSHAGSEEPRLEPAAPPMALMNSTNWGQTLTTKSRVALSRGASVHAGYARTLESGTPVRVEGVGQDWYAVYSPSETAPDPARVWGYAPRAELEGQARVAPEATVSAAPTAAPIPTEVPPRPAGPDLTPAPAPPTAAPASSPSAGQTKSQAPSVQASTAKNLANPFTPRRPEMPVADSTLHGYRYKILESEEDRVGDVAVIEVKVFLDVTVLPEQEALKDFSRSIWRQKRQAGRDVVLDIFLPDMNPNGLAYAVAHFDPRGELEFWLRRTMLFGTRFLP
ncbi:hypothetical protein [Desulfovibrio aminophilus]|uniref:hypothetical protein n=1 Tax=Desulfovibrio aminophilus TaxID=81425 RepID=UPI003395F27A